MGFRRVQVMMMLLLLSGGFASGQAMANDDSDDDVRHVSAFFPDVKPFVPDTHEKAVSASNHQSKVHHVASKPRHVSIAVKSPKVTESVAVKTSSGFHPKSKPFVPMTHGRLAKSKSTHVLRPAIKSFKPEKIALKKSHVAKHHVMPSVPGNDRSLAIVQSAKINFAANSKPRNIINTSVANLEIKDDIQQALQSNTVNAKKTVAINTSKIVPVKVDAVVKGRVDEKIQARNSKIDVITSAAVGVDPNKIDTSKAIHSIFVSQPKKAKSFSAAVSAQTAKNVTPTAKADALIGVAAARQAMIDDSEAGKVPVVKVVTADLSKNEFYILGESEPVPEHLKNNPETQMVVLGGEVDDAAKKIMEFKLAALNAARVRAAKELAEKQASAKALAELEIEEKEAMAKLAAAQKAVDDMQKLKKWQKEKENHIGTVVEKVTPEYKKAIVQTVVPEEMHTNAVAEKQEDKLVPINQIALSAEKVADDLGHEGVIPHINDTVAEVKIAPVLKPAARKVVAKKKSHKSVESVAEKQINDEINSIKSAKHHKTVRSATKHKAPVKQKSMATKSTKKLKQVKKPIELHQQIPAEQTASNVDVINKGTEALVAPKAVLIDEKKNMSLQQLAKPAAAIKLAKTKNPARP